MALSSRGESPCRRARSRARSSCDPQPGSSSRCSPNRRRASRGPSPTPGHVGRSQATPSSTTSRTSPTPTPTRSPPCHRAHTHWAQSSPPGWCTESCPWRRSGGSPASDSCHSCRWSRFCSSPVCVRSCPCHTTGSSVLHSRPALPSPTPPSVGNRYPHPLHLTPSVGTFTLPVRYTVLCVPSV